MSRPARLVTAVATAVVTATVIATACSSATSDTATTTATTVATTATNSSASNTSSTSSTSTTAEPSDAALVGAGALGDGWTARNEPVTPEDDARLAEACPSIARRAGAHVLARRARTRLARDGQPLPTVSDDLRVYTATGASADVFNAFASGAMLRCLPALVAAAGLDLGGVRVHRVAAPDTGLDESSPPVSAIRLDGTSIAAGVASLVMVELLVVQRGPALHVLVVTSSDLYRFDETARAALVAAASH